MNNAKKITLWLFLIAICIALLFSLVSYYEVKHYYPEIISLFMNNKLEISIVFCVLMTAFFFRGKIIQFFKFIIEYKNLHKEDIIAGTMPPTVGQHLTNLIYQHKFGLPLLVILLVTMGIIFMIQSPIGQNFINSILPIDKGRGTFLLALISAPTIVYAWFIRAHERTLNIKKEEDELWSKELNELINQAVDTNQSEGMREVAIRPLQDYLTGAKWASNQAANTSRILQAFSSIIDNLEIEQGQKKSPFNLETLTKPNSPIELKSRLLDVISSVLRGAFTKRKNGKRVLKVIGDNMAELNLSYLNLVRVDFNGLILNSTKLNSTVLNFSKLSGAKLNNATLNRAKLNYAELNDAVLFKAELNNAKLNYAKLNYAELNYAKLNNAQLNNAELNDAVLFKAELNNAELNYAELNNAKLNNATLNRAELNNAELNYAELKNAQLNHAKLKKAEFNKADINKADFSDAQGLTCEVLTTAINWQTAKRDVSLACGEEIPET